MIGLMLSKKTDKGSCIVVWEGNNYVLEAQKQLSDPTFYRDIGNRENILPKSSEVSKKMFSSLRSRGFITEKQLKYFTCVYKKATNLGKPYLLPKSHKQLFDALGGPTISNCGTCTEKFSTFLDHHLKKAMQNGWSYIKESEDFIKKINNLDSTLENAFW